MRLKSTSSSFIPLERQREQLLRLIAEALPTAAKPMNLSALVQHMGAPLDQRLRKIQKDLVESTDAIRNVNTESRLSFTHCQRWASNTLRFFQHWMGGADVYSVTGNMRSGSAGGRLVSGNVYASIKDRRGKPTCQISPDYLISVAAP